MKIRNLLLGLMVIFVSCGRQSSELATISCRIGDEVVKQLEIYKLVNGEKVLLASATPDSTHSFGFRFVPDYEGFYWIGDVRSNQYPIYVKAGATSSVYIGKDTVYLEGSDNSEEMKILYQWQGLVYPLENHAIRFWNSDWTYKKVYPAFEAFLPRFDEFRQQINTSNPRFNELMSRYVDYYKDYLILGFEHTPRSEWPNPIPRIAYHSEIIEPAKLQDEMLLDMPWGASLLKNYADYYVNDKNLDYMDLDNILTFIPNPRLRGEIVLSRMKITRTYPAYSQMMEQFGKELNPEQLKRAQAMGAKLYEDKVGMPAPDFTSENINGKKVSLSDLKGNVVLIDVWATWCGPCRGEIPHLKKLEKAFAGEKVEFVSVSVDEPKDKAKWAKMVKDEHLSGVQLFGGEGWKSKIAMDFKINAIPRFILIDKQGNVVNSKAPRPSEPILKRLIEMQLKK